MKLSKLSTKSAFQFAVSALFLASASTHLFAGGVGPGDGGVQIVFSDDGAGNTAVTASGTGNTNDDSDSLSGALGFADDFRYTMTLKDNDKLLSGNDLTDPIPEALTALTETMGPIPLSDPISFAWEGDVSGGSPQTFIFPDFLISEDSPEAVEDKTSKIEDTMVITRPLGRRIAFLVGKDDDFIDIMAGGAVMSVEDGNGTIPLPYSTFASVHGRSFPSTDGFTFVFAPPAPSTTNTPATRARPDLLIGKGFNRLKGDNIYNQKTPSKKQTLNHSGTIFIANTSKASLLITNDGGTRGDFKFKTSGDKFTGMKIQAFAHTNNGRNNISGDLKRSSYDTKVAPGGSERLSYQLKTNRFWAGALRNGERENIVIFRLSGASNKDHASMVTRFRE